MAWSLCVIYIKPGEDHFAEGVGQMYSKRYKYESALALIALKDSDHYSKRSHAPSDKSSFVKVAALYIVVFTLS